MKLLWLANAAAYLAIAVLVGVAAVIADRFGFLGLLIVGTLIWLVCTRAILDGDVPTGGVGVLKAALARPRSPEERAALHTDRQATALPLRFYGRCGAFLAVTGAVGFVLQLWRN